MAQRRDRHPACGFQADQPWLTLQFHDDGTIKKPDELEKEMDDPPKDIDYSDVLDRIHGSMIGMAVGDALGAFVEFRPHSYMTANPVTELQGGGTWGLQKGQFTDDTSMGLCLANSLIARRDYVPYDQLVRYKWWHQNGYMSSTGRCFDIGAATRQSLVEFECRQKAFATQHDIYASDIDFLSDRDLLDEFDENCSKDGVAGNGALMRLAPVPLFFFRDPVNAVNYSGHSGEITHGDEKAYDACRYYGALIVAAVRGETKERLLDENFYKEHELWFGSKPLHEDIMDISLGSYKKKGYDEGIRGKGYIVNALEAALWAFWSDKNSFKEGALAAVNLGDDTDTTAAIYGQLAGACYGYGELHKDWTRQVYAKKFIKCLSKWIAYEGAKWSEKHEAASTIPKTPVRPSSRFGSVESPSKKKTSSGTQSKSEENKDYESKPPTQNPSTRLNTHSKFEQLNQSHAHERVRRNTFNNSDAQLKPDVGQQAAAIRAESAKHSQRIFSNENLTSCPEVCKWVRKLGKDFTTYVKFFQDHDVNGYWLLNHISDKILEDYGIKDAKHRQIILDEIEKLKKKSKITVVHDES